MKNIKTLFCSLLLALVCQIATAQQDDSLKIYPNPFPDSCTFEITNLTNDTVTLEVINRWGEVIKNFHTRDVLDGDYTYTFHGDTLPPAVYYVSYNVNGEQKGQTIIKVNPTNIGENEKNHLITIVPNPTKDYIYFELPYQGSEKSYEYQIISSNGKVVAKGKQIAKRIDIHYLPKGNYLLRINQSNSEKFTCRFVVDK